MAAVRQQSTAANPPGDRSGPGGRCKKRDALAAARVAHAGLMMDGWFDIDWSGILAFSVPPLELVVRGSLMYWFLFLVFRFLIRRDVGAVGVADILVLVIVADAAQNAMAGEYTSVADGIVLVSTLIFWNMLLDRLSFLFPRFRSFATAPPLCLVRKGRILYHNMRKESITEEELWSHLRQQGVDKLEQVEKAFLESDGGFSVIRSRE